MRPGTFSKFFHVLLAKLPSCFAGAASLPEHGAFAWPLKNRLEYPHVSLKQQVLFRPWKSLLRNGPWQARRTILDRTSRKF